MTVVAAGRSRDAAQDIAKQYRRKGYTVRIEEQYHPHGPGRAFKVITEEEVPRGTGARSAPPLTPEEAAKVHELLEAQKFAEPEEKHAVALAISSAIRRPKEKPDVDVKIIKDVSGKVIDVEAPTYLKPFHSGYTGRVVYPVVEARKEYEKTGEIPKYAREQITLPSELAEIGITEPQYETRVYKTHLGYFTEQQYTEWVLGRAKGHYTQTGIIPSHVSEAIYESMPFEIKKAGKHAREEYSRVAYRKILELDTEHYEEQLVKNLQASYWYMSTQSVWDGKTWKELKQEHPDYHLVISAEKPFWHIEQRPEKKPDKPSLGGLAAWFTMPIGTRLQYAYASLTRPIDKDYTKPETDVMKNIRQADEQIAKDLWKKRDWLGGGIRIVSSPFGLVGTSYLAGKILGGFAATRLGQKPLFQVGLFEKKIAAAPEWTYKYTIPITPSKIVGGGIAAGFGYKTVESGIEAAKEGQLASWAAIMAVTMPLVYYPYKWGYYSGMGWVQRRSAMSKIKGLDRVRQDGIYEAMDQVYKMPEPRFKTKAYDLTRIQRIDTSAALRVSQYLRSERGRLFLSSRPKLGGSSSTYMQLPRGWFRSGGQPYSIQRWAISRQIASGRYKPLTGKQRPGDIDLLIRDLWGGMKRADYLRQPHVVDIHSYKTGSYLGFGKLQLKPTKGTIYDTLGLMDVKALSLREQFIRKSISILPSETKITGYRSYKDIPDWWDIGEAFRYTVGSKKLGAALEKVLYPEHFPIPKKTFSEWFVKRFGGAVEPKWVETFGGMFIEPVYPAGMYPKPYTPLLVAGAYPVSPYKTDYKTPTYPIPKYVTPGYPTSGYPISKILSYKTPTLAAPGITPSITPTYKPPSYLTPGVPTYKIPGYPTPDIPTYPPPKIPIYPPPDVPPYSPPYERRKEEKLQKIARITGQEKTIREPGQAYNVLVKDRYIVSGEKRYREKFSKMNTKPLSKHDALSLGGHLVDQSAAASFKIKPTSGKPQSLELPVDSWSWLSDKFYQKPKTKTYVEHTDYRIDTIGELNEITARGILANMQKQHSMLSFKPKSSKLVDSFISSGDMFEITFEDMSLSKKKLKQLGGI